MFIILFVSNQRQNGQTELANQIKKTFLLNSEQVLDKIIDFVSDWM